MSDKEYLHDLRIVERNISEGKISEKEHNKFIKDLEDVSEKSQILVIDDDTLDEEILETEKTEDDEMGI
ncbi:MAG: hypothetical protein ACRENO_00955 [Thermodesulfobacteriota bacterium]